MLRRSTASDQEIIRQVLSGQRERFAVLVERYLPVLHAFAYVHTGNHADAEDVVQDTFLRAYERLGTLQEGKKLGAWLLGIARNCTQNLGRKQARAPVTGATTSREAVASVADPADRELGELLRQQIMSLDESQREVLLLHYFAGRKTREIAVMLSLSHAAVRKRLQRAREALGERMMRCLKTSLEPETPERERVARVMHAVVAAQASWSPGAGGVVSGIGVMKLVPVILALVMGGVGLLSYFSGWVPTPWAQEAPIVEYPSTPLEPQPLTPDTLDEPSAREADVPGEALAAAIEPNHETEPRRLRVYGTVVDMQGKPASGARVEGHCRVGTPYRNGGESISCHRALCDGSGDFELRVPPLQEDMWGRRGKRIQLQLRAYGEGGCALRDINLPPRSPYLLMLQPVGQIAGVVVNAADQPIAGARVSVCVRQHAAGAAEVGYPDAVLTDANGAFAFPDLWEGRWQFRVTASGYAPKTTGAVATDGRPVRIVLATGGAVEGHIVEAGSIRPVPGVAVDIWSVGPREPLTGMHASTRTNYQGAFDFGGLGPDDYKLGLNESSRLVLVGERPGVHILREETVSGIVMEVGLGAVIEGRVSDAGTHEGVADVAILAATDRESPEARTDSDGAYRLEGVPAGECRVIAMANATGVWTPRAETRLKVELGRRYTGVDLQLDFRYQIAGHVVDQDGNPVPFAAVRIAADGIRRVRRVTTNENGAFVTYYDCARKGVHIEARRSQDLSEPIGPMRLTRRGLHDVTLVLLPGACLSGVVVDRQDRIRDSILVTAVPEHPVSGLPVPDPLEDGNQPFGIGAYSEPLQGMDHVYATASGPAGQFTFRGLLPGVYELAATRSHERLDRKRVERVALGIGETVEDVRLLVDTGGPSGSVEGVIRIGDQPASYVNVLVGDASYTDRHGRYLIEEAPPGEHQLNVMIDFPVNGAGDERMREFTRPELVHVAVGKTTRADWTIPQAQGALEGRVTANGAPVDSAAVWVRHRGLGGMAQIIEVETDAEGNYRVEGVPAGENRVSVTLESANGRNEITRAGTAITETGRTTRLDFDLLLGFVRGEVAGLQPDEIAYVGVVPGQVDLHGLTTDDLLRLREEVVLETTVEGDGPFDLQGGLEPGVYTAFAAAAYAHMDSLEEALPTVRLATELIEVGEEETWVHLSLVE